jgi:LPXTG-site transpeptidase (sortase) family protein
MSSHWIPVPAPQVVSASAVRTGWVISARPRTEIWGNMNFTFRIKTKILSAAILTSLAFAAGVSARVITKAHVTSVHRPNGKTLLRVDIPSRTARVGKIEIPALGLATMVLEGDDAGILRLAVGHIPGTALPGPSGNVGLAGHNNTFFRPLQKINLGDEIRYSTTAGTFTYRVVSLRVVLPSAVEVLNATPQPTLTLVTCYPFNSTSPAPKRFIVHAEMVNSSPNRKN